MSNNVEVDIDVAGLDKAIKIARLVCPGADYLNFHFGKGQHEIVVAEKDHHVKVALENCKAKGSVKFCMNLFTLQSIMKGHKELIFTVEDSKVVFRSGKGKYKGELAIPPYTPIKPPSKFKSDFNWKLSGDDLLAFNAALQRVHITDVYLDSEMDVHVAIRSDGLHVVSYDDFHFAYYHNEHIKGEKGEFSVPYRTFDTINKMLASYPEESGFTMKISGAMIFAQNDWFQCYIPLVQSEKQHGVALIRKLIKNFPKPVASVQVSKSALLRSMDNIKGIHRREENCSVLFSRSNKGIKMAITTSFGTIQSGLTCGKMKWDKSLKVQCDPLVFANVIGVIRGSKLALHVIEDRALYVRETDNGVNCHYSCCLTT